MHITLQLPANFAIGLGNAGLSKFLRIEMNGPTVVEPRHRSGGGKDGQEANEKAAEDGGYHVAGFRDEGGRAAGLTARCSRWRTFWRCVKRRVLMGIATNCVLLRLSKVVPFVPEKYPKCEVRCKNQASVIVVDANRSNLPRSGG